MELIQTQSDDRLIPLEEAEGAFHRLAKKCKVTHDPFIYAALDLLKKLSVDLGVGPVIPYCEVKGVMKKFGRAIEDDDAGVLTIQEGLRVDKVVGIEEFIVSKEYMSLKRVIRPRVLKELVGLFEDDYSDEYMEVALAGGIGWGKSFFSQCGIAYLLYVLSCFHCPQIEFGLAPGTSIVFVMQSVKLELAKKVAFNQFGGMLRQSRYFTKYFPYVEGITSELRFPNEIFVFPISSSDTAALGLNVYGGMIDELNFMSVVEKSEKVKIKRSGREEYDQAEKLYTTIQRRMKSRFLFAGKVPGKLFLISSANYPEDFMDRKIKESEKETQEKGRSSIYVVNMPQWEAFEGLGRISEETFLVEVGDAARRSRIIESREEAVEPKSVIEVPVDYRHDFEQDLEGAIRDLAGIPIGGVDSFIKQREMIEAAARAHEELFEGKQLFTRAQVEISTFENSMHALIDKDYLEMLLDRKVFFTAHVDLALTGDSCGLAVSHFHGYKHIGKAWNWDEATQKYVEMPAGQYPSYCVDGVLEIIPPMNDEIDTNLVSDLIGVIAGHVNLVYVTADQFQSASLLQRARKMVNAFRRRIRSATLSVDANIGPYAECKQAFRDGRILLPNVERVKKEFRDLQLDSKKMKVDHPPGGSKDCSDGVAGSAYVIFIKKRPIGVTGGQDDKSKQGSDQGRRGGGRPRSGRRRIH
jgi:hypothetical protein